MRWTRPSWIVFHSAAGMMRGTKSNGKMRSRPSFSPYTVKVMPWFMSASFCRRSRRSTSSRVKDSRMEMSAA